MQPTRTQNIHMSHSRTSAFNDDQVPSDSDEEAHVWMASSGKNPSIPRLEEALGRWIHAQFTTSPPTVISFSRLNQLLSVKVANGNRIPATEKGSTIISITANGVKKTSLLAEIYYAKGIDRTLISVAQLTERGNSCEFGKRCFINSKTGQVVAEIDLSPQKDFGQWESKKE